MCYVIKITKQSLAEGHFLPLLPFAVVTLLCVCLRRKNLRNSATETGEAFEQMEVLMCGI